MRGPTGLGSEVRRGAMALLLAGIVLSGCARDRAERREREARGAAYADSVAAAYGGREAWQALRYVRFDLSLREGERVRARFRHLWNLTTGDCRYEGDLGVVSELPRRPETAKRIPRGTTFPAGKLVALMNRETGVGHVRVERPPGSTDALPKDDVLLALARERVEEDGFWLFLPFLLGDPAVTLEDMGPDTTRSGLPAREIRMTRKQGRGAGAITVRLWLEPGTHRILETEAPAPDGTPRVFQWRTEVNVGGVRLVAERRESENRAMIFDLMAAPERIGPEVFTDLNRRMPY